MKPVRTVTITEEEYFELKSRAEIDWALVEKIKRSLEDVKAGKLTEWKHSK